MTPSGARPDLRLYANMALDAYDPRTRTNDPDAPAVADPAVEARFAGWDLLETARASSSRDASSAYPSGMEANIYVDGAAQHVVVAFRGTEFGRILSAIDDGRIGLLRKANLDDDLVTLLGYYQDGGATVSAYLDAAGGLGALLETSLGLSPGRAGDIAGIAAFLGGPGGLDGLIAEGEETLRGQVQGAIDTVMAAAEANPGHAISLTGHSLGGALAAAAAGALGLPAVLLDPAPYAAPGLLDFARDDAEARLAQIYPGLDADAAGFDLGPAPETHLADLVATHRLAGSFVPDLYLSGDPARLPEGASTDTVIDLTAPLADGVDLHAPALLALVLDSAARAGDAPDRPAFADLAARLPSLVALASDPAIVAAGGPGSDAFQRALLVSDPLYDLLVATVAALETDLAAYAPPGSGVLLGAEVERAALGAALSRLAETVSAEAIDPPAGLDAVLGAQAGGPGPDILILPSGVPDRATPGAGPDLVALGLGPDTLAGGLGDLDGDRLLDFAAEDRIVLEGVALEPAGASLIEGGRTLLLEGRGGASARLALDRPGDPATLSVTAAGDGTEIAFAPLSAGADETVVRRVALLFEAGVGRKAAEPGLNHWVDRRAEGLSEIDLAAAFLAAPEFESRAGAPADELTDAALVEQLFLNVLDRPGAAAGVAHWTGRLATPEFGPEAALLAFAVSEENLAGAEGLDRLAEIEPGVWAFA